MKLDSLSGHIRLLVLLAELMGASCIGGAVTFFTRTPRPYGELFVAWFLVAISALFVIIIGAVWLYSYWYWRHAMGTERDYWNTRIAHDGG